MRTIHGKLAFSAGKSNLATQTTRAKSWAFTTGMRRFSKTQGGDISYIYVSRILAAPLSAANVCICQYDDLLRIMRQSAVSHGADLRPNCRVTSLSVPETGRPSVRLASGEVIHADVVVGSDGSDSVVRTEVLGQELRGTPLGLTIFKYVSSSRASLCSGSIFRTRSVTIPRAKLAADPIFADLMRETVSILCDRISSLRSSAIVFSKRLR